MGGGVHNQSSTSELALVSCVFSGNTAQRGGAIGCAGASPTIRGCLIQGNLAVDMDSGAGGGISCDGGSPRIESCSIAGNTAFGSYGSGGGILCSGSNPVIVNCTVWQNSPQAISVFGGVPVVTYSNTEGASGEDWFGTGCIDIDPMFVQPGYWDDNGTPGDPDDDYWVDGDYRLQVGSPCINTGDPSDLPGLEVRDLDGYPRLMCGRVDMGAYENGWGRSGLRRRHRPNGLRCVGCVLDRSRQRPPMPTAALRSMPTATWTWTWWTGSTSWSRSPAASAVDADSWPLLRDHR